LGQLKILQEIMTLSVFVPFAALYMNETPDLDYLRAGLCMVGAAYFIFRGDHHFGRGTPVRAVSRTASDPNGRPYSTRIRNNSRANYNNR